MKRPVLLLAIATMTVGCQTAVRQYDGVLGYSSTAMPDGRYLISYTDESRANWDDMEKTVSTICAHTLSATRETTRLVNLKKEAFSQNVDMAFITAPGKQDGGKREMPLRRITAECAWGAKVESETVPLPVQKRSEPSPPPKKNQNDGCAWIGGPSPQDQLGCKFFHENEQNSK